MKKSVLAMLASLTLCTSVFAAEGPCERKYDVCRPKVVETPKSVELPKTVEPVLLAAEGPCERKYDTCGLQPKPKGGTKLVEEVETPVASETAPIILAAEGPCERKYDVCRPRLV